MTNPTHDTGAEVAVALQKARRPRGTLRVYESMEQALRDARAAGRAIPAIVEGKAWKVWPDGICRVGGWRTRCLDDDGHEIAAWGSLR